MESLNIKQVEIIASEVHLAKISLSHLADDLIDHICCEVETEMSLGKSFKEAYEAVKQIFGIRDLQKIQENTRYLIDKNYKLMKTTMKVSGLVSLILLGLATVFKIMHWPWAGVGMVLGFFILGMLFFPSAIYVNFRDSHKKKNLLLHLTALLGGIIFMAGILFKIMHWPWAGFMIIIGTTVLLWIFLPILLYVQIKKAKSRQEKVLYVIGVFSLIIFEMATAFKIMHWPGAMVLMLFGSVMMFSVFLPIYTSRKFKETGRITGQFIFLIITSMFAILFTFLLAVNVSKDILGNFVRQDENTIKINKYLESRNEKAYAEYKSLSDSVHVKCDSSVAVLKTYTQELCVYIEDLKIQIIQLTDGTEKQIAVQKAENPAMIQAKDNRDVVSYLMLGENNNGKASELKMKIEMYKSTVLKLAPTNPRIKTLIEKSLNTGDVVDDDVKQNWESQIFFAKAMISIMPALSDIEMNLRQIELEALNSIVEQNNNLK